MMRNDGPIFGRGVVRNGRLRIEQSNVFAAQLQSLRDGVVEIQIERKRATRSQQANRFYWGVLVDLVASHTGYTPDEIHEIFKAKFLPKRLAVQDGNGEIKGEFVIGGTTTKLTTGEFSDYCRAIEQWATEDLGIMFPSDDAEARDEHLRHVAACRTDGRDVS